MTEVNLQKSKVRSVGFTEFPQGWEGPKLLRFAFISEHAKSVRYQVRLRRRVFDLYLPKVMLQPDAPTPAEIVVAIGRSMHSMRTIGFTQHATPLERGPELCEFDFFREMVNSIQYRVRIAGKDYALYIPREVFEREKPPSRVFLKIGIPIRVKPSETMESRLELLERRVATLENLVRGLSTT